MSHYSTLIHVTRGTAAIYFFSVRCKEQILFYYNIGDVTIIYGGACNVEPGRENDVDAWSLKIISTEALWEPLWQSLAGRDFFCAMTSCRASFKAILYALLDPEMECFKDSSYLCFVILWIWLLSTLAGYRCVMVEASSSRCTYRVYLLFWIFSAW